ncbi:class I SAM-dependent methyltransferase [Vulgatibacter sp.]|uniref:class I SAM-dependent methyltransferase n=1 Tax=Vulgatibacter sp. TaxID=1971226 RepID=UPI00356679A6
MQLQLSSLPPSPVAPASRASHHVAFVRALVEKGGPVPADFPAIGTWLNELRSDLADGSLDAAGMAEVRAAFGDALSVETVQGMAYVKPRGYAGDFEVIDRIYRLHAAPQQHLRRWDECVHALGATRAVRNRKSYFHRLLEAYEASHPEAARLTVLNVASGPGRDMYEYLEMQLATRVHFDCVEYDANAIEFAGDLCRDHASRVGFTQANVLRFKSQKRYGLIWSAGLFDYFDDRRFVLVLRRLLACLAEEGELVVGNFATGHASRDYMELVCDWNLHHRSPEDLVELALQAGVAREDIRVGREEEGVNLFLHLKRGAAFVER